MIKIAICDDEKKDLESLANLITKFFTNNEIEFNISKFECGKDLLEYSKNFDMVFLDIELSDSNGISIAKKINENIRDYKLILISNYSEYLRDGYKVNADRFFTKPINELEFKLEMKEVLKDYIVDSHYIIDEKISRKKIYIRDILYVEMLARKTYLHTKNQIYETTYPLHYWKDMLTDFYFIQTHKSFLVNFNNIKEYTNHDIILVGEKSVPLSRFYKDDFMRKYIKYINRKI